MATLKYVLSLIAPLEGYRQDIYWFLNADSGAGRICLGFSGFHFCLRVLDFQWVPCLCFTGWSRCQRCQRSSWWSRSKGTLYSTLYLTDAQVLGLSLLHGNLEMNSRLSLVFLRKKHNEMSLAFAVTLFKTITCPVCSLIKDIKFRMLLSRHKSSFSLVFIKKPDSLKLNPNCSIMLTHISDVFQSIGYLILQTEAAFVHMIRV